MSSILRNILCLSLSINYCFVFAEESYIGSSKAWQINSTGGEVSGYQTSRKRLKIKSQFENDLKKLVEEVPNNPYSLSLPLMASAFLGNAQIYSNLRNQIIPMLNNINQPGFKAWLLGRVFLASTTIMDTDTSQSIKLELSKLVDGDSTRGEITDPDYSMLLWGMEYLISNDRDSYLLKREDLSFNLDRLMEAAKSRSLDHELVSNVVWVHVLAISASTIINDNEMYQHAIRNVNNIFAKNNIGDSLITGLIRNDKSSDYPAWAVAIVASAAKKLNDESNYRLLFPLAEQSIQEAKSWGEKQEDTWKSDSEVLLAEIYLLYSVEK